MASDILIVDDEADIREGVSGILSDEGHNTRTAKNSDEALAAIEVLVLTRGGARCVRASCRCWLLPRRRRPR